MERMRTLTFHYLGIRDKWFTYGAAGLGLTAAMAADGSWYEWVISSLFLVAALVSAAVGYVYHRKHVFHWEMYKSFLRETHPGSGFHEHPLISRLRL